MKIILKQISAANNKKRQLWMLTAISLCMYGCTKIGGGYIAPNMDYLVTEFDFTAGQVSSSYALNSNGSNMPINVQWTHIYDSAGNIVDTLFTKKYAVGIWKSAYNANTDTTYAQIMAKRSSENLPPITLDSTTGVFTSTAASYYVPHGIYTVDLKVANQYGAIFLKQAITMNIKAGVDLQTYSSAARYLLGLLVANTASTASYNGGTLANLNPNPFIKETITRYADTPNLFVLKVIDKNGVVFNGKKGEIQKRPNSGLNPNPPFLYNLQDYAPDTFNEPDSGTLNLLYPLTPFPINFIAGNLNMYYRIPTAFLHIDSTSNWPATQPNHLVYTGTNDPHFLGYFKDNLYDLLLRFPLRIYVPGSYELTVQILNVTHR